MIVHDRPGADPTVSSSYTDRTGHRWTITHNAVGSDGTRSPYDLIVSLWADLLHAYDIARQAIAERDDLDAALSDAEDRLTKVADARGHGLT